MGGSGAPSTSKVQFWGGQREAGGRLFEPGGIFEQILAGGPNVRTEQAASRGVMDTQRAFAARGQEGSGLEARAISDAAFKGNVAREGGQIEDLLSLLQPPGTKSGPAGGIYPYLAAVNAFTK
jgi:hypothetical protein